MDNSLNGHVAQGNRKVEWVWYSGTDAIKEGEAVCYNTDFGTATAANARRGNYVERPSTSNNNAFAGVAARDYAAQSGGQFIEINVPGSKGVMVALGVDTVIDTGILTFQVGGGSAAGRFVKAGYIGRGSIVPRQTVTAVLEASMTGAWSLATDGITLTVVSTAGLAAGDTVVLLGGEDDGTGAVVAGKYTIASITNGTVLVLTSTALTATAAGAALCTGYAYTGNPKCLADMMDGEESGGVQFVVPPNTGGAAVMGTYMSGGVTYILGGITVGTADANGALADGAYLGQKKGFYCLGTLTTNDVKVTPATAGLQDKVLDAIDTGAQGDPLALASVTFDAAAERIYLVWWGVWVEQASAGCAIAAS
jgi:hypothetical protein